MSTSHGTCTSPMAISVVEITIKYGPLSQANKDYCRTNGLCLHCRTKGHLASIYPNKIQKVNLTTEPSTTMTLSATVLDSTTKTPATLVKN